MSYEVRGSGLSEAERLGVPRSGAPFKRRLGGGFSVTTTVRVPQVAPQLSALTAVSEADRLSILNLIRF